MRGRPVRGGYIILLENERECVCVCVCICVILCQTEREVGEIIVLFKCQWEK